MEPQCTPCSDQQNKNKETTRSFPLEANATQNTTPASAPSTITSEIQQTVADCLRRTNSCVENNTNKYKCLISSERIQQLRKIVDTAIKEHKVFTIKGGWNTLRNAFLRRNWVEKYEYSAKKPPPSLQNPEDLVMNLPVKQEWETQAAYLEKCEKTIKSRLLQNHDVDFYWNMRKDVNDWHHRLSSNKIMNRFSRSFYTSKEGLALLLQQMYWYNETNVAHVNFPRCYVLAFPDHFGTFVEDFRMTACIGLLKWFTAMYEKDDVTLIKSPEGKIPFSSLQFAIDRCCEFIATQKHLDIDRDFAKVWDHEWDQFLAHFYSILHRNELFLDSKGWSLSIMNASAKSTLKEISNYWPDYSIDGMKNIWILKPGNKCRGRGIQLIKHLEDVVKIMNLKLKYVVQKYIERPLVIYQTKFDIRQWFMVTSVQPLVVWMYRECYLRFSSQIFSLENFHESLHLTNHAVQCKYSNVVQRDQNLPDENMWDCHKFQNYLKQIGHANKWNDVIFPGMKEGIVAAMLASQDTMDRRPNTFELYGADFMLCENFTPWLLEINSSPDLSYSTSVTAKMCPQVLEDLVKVLIDKRRDPTASTGSFECIYKQSLPRPPAYLGMSLAVRGRRIFKCRLKIGKSKEKIKDKENKIIKAKDKDALKPNNLRTTTTVMKSLPKIILQDLYKGPVIGDLIEEIQHTIHGEGVNFVPSLPVDDQKKKNRSKSDRVSKKLSENKSNKNNFVLRKRNAPESTSHYFYPKSKLNICMLNNTLTESNKNPKLNTLKTPERKDILWEKETANILKGKNISTKLSARANSR